MNSLVKSRAQVSLEYLLILAGFFAVLAAILPSISYATEAFNTAQDTVLAKQISEKISEQTHLFYYLGDGSKKEFEFFSQTKIVVESDGSKILVSSNQKIFESETRFEQNIPKTELVEKFFMLITKENGQTKVSFYSK